MSLACHVVGVTSLLVALGSIVLGARRVRARVLPGWMGSLEWLVVSIMGLTAITIAAELLGAFGLLKIVPLALVLTATGIVAYVAAARPPASTSEASAPLERVPPLTMPAAVGWVVAIAVVVVVAQWSTATVRSFQDGMTSVDGLWYHMPIAARIAQSGSAWNLHVVDTSSLTLFYPAGSELLHSVGMVFLGNDAISRLLNLGWLALALLASYCIGLRYGVARLTLLGAAALFATPQLVTLDAGQGLNDLAVVALLLSAVAVIVHAVEVDDRTSIASIPLAVAAMAAGLAAGTKWTTLVPVAALTVAVLVLARPGERVRQLGVWLLTVVVTGGFWYLRNLVAVGNPIPPLRVGIGPLHLPRVRIGIPTFSIVHYLSDGEVWRRDILPGLRTDFGPTWWLVLLLAAAGLVCGLILTRGRTERLVAFVGVACVVGYVLTEQGFNPRLWYGTPRYAAPGLALGFVLLPIALSQRSYRATLLTVPCFAVPLVATQLDDQLWQRWWDGSALATVAVPFAVTMLAVIITRAAIRGSHREAAAPRRGWAIAIASALIVTAAGGLLVHRYRETLAPNVLADQEATRLLRAAHVRDVRIALVGDLFLAGGQYQFYDTDLTNHVQFVADRAPHHTVRPFTSCPSLMDALRDGNYDYVVLTNNQAAQWLSSDPTARFLLGDTRSRVALVRLNGPPNPALCGPGTSG